MSGQAEEHPRVGPVEFVYDQVDDCEITADYYIPKTSSDDQALPLIMFIHGGAYMLGNSRMNSSLQIEDCLARGWIVIAPNHRLCPQVDVLEGPVTDCRILWQWVHAGHLEHLLQEKGIDVKVDKKKMVVIGTSAGGQLAYTLAFPDQPNPPLAILDFYGSKSPLNPFWKCPIDSIPAPPMQQNTKSLVMSETPTATKHSLSLEGQSSGPPKPIPDPRFTLAMNLIKTAQLWPTIYPRSQSDPSSYKLIDSMQNVHPLHPPVCIVHGMEDEMVPFSISQAQHDLLRENGIESLLIPVPGEGHTFAGKMERGTKTWDTQRRGFDWLEQKIKGVRD